MRYLNTLIIALAVSMATLAVYQKFILPKHTYKIYTIDTDKIVNMQKKKLLEAYKNGNDISDKIAKENEKMMKIVNFIAKKDNAIVLAKKAVISADEIKVYDITNKVLRAVNEY